METSVDKVSLCPVPEQSWPCSYCTYHNGENRKTCGLCGLERDYDGDVDFARLAATRAEEDEGQESPSPSQALFAVVPARRILNGALRGIFALVGSFAGAVAGAVAAHSSRGGLVRGVGLGALAGAIVSMEALETSPLLLQPNDHRSLRGSSLSHYRTIGDVVVSGSDASGTSHRRSHTSSNTNQGGEEGGDGDRSAAVASNPSGIPEEEASRRGAGLLSNLLSPLSGLQIRIMHWQMLSLDAGLEFALREMRIPPEALFRISSNTNRNTYTYPTRDVTVLSEDGTRIRTHRSLLLENNSNQRGSALASSSGSSSVPGLSPDQLRRVPYKTLEMGSSSSALAPVGTAAAASTSNQKERQRDEDQEGQAKEGKLSTSNLSLLNGNTQGSSQNHDGRVEGEGVHSFHDFPRGQCAICFECFKPGEHVRVLPACKHDFHARCLDPWLRKKGSCPMCRRPVIVRENQD